MTTWYFILESNSTLPPCSSQGIDTHVKYSIDNLPIRNWGCYQAATYPTNKDIMNVILNSNLFYPTDTGDIYYTLSDIVYVNGVIWGDITDVIDVLIQPHSWIGQDTAITSLIGKLTDISGLIINFFSKYGIVQYQYISTEFLKSGTNIIMRINLRSV